MNLQVNPIPRTLHPGFSKPYATNFGGASKAGMKVGRIKDPVYKDSDFRSTPLLKPIQTPPTFVPALDPFENQPVPLRRRRPAPFRRRRSRGPDVGPSMVYKNGELS